MSTSTAPYPVLEGTRVSQMWRVEVQAEGEKPWQVVHLTEHRHQAERTLHEKQARELRHRATAQAELQDRPRRRYRLVTWNETMIRADLRVVTGAGLE